MILGHAFAFMVINYGIEKDSFESPWKSFVKTTTMALGEFQVIHLPLIGPDRSHDLNTDL